jgi:protein-tyrosine phosphatase
MKREHIKKPTHLLVVCHGNICRSPLAGEALKKELGKRAVVETAGFRSMGQRASKKVREFALRNSLDLTFHRSKRVTGELLHWADVILYMDGGNEKRLREQSAPIEKMINLGQVVGLSRIPDPNFTPRGPKLDQILQLILTASRKFSESIV